MSHPLVLGLFDDARAAAAGARGIRALGVVAEDLSVVARDHEEAGALAHRLGGTPGSDIEDSRGAARLGELGAQILAAIAVVMPGIGPILAAGPLGHELGDAAGHAAGGLASVLARAGVPHILAEEWQQRVQQGSVLLGVHVRDGRIAVVERALHSAGARDVQLAEWP